GEDQSEVFLHRPGFDRHLVTEARFFRRLLRAASVALKFPAMIETSQRISINPCRGKLGAPVRTSGFDEKDIAAFAAVECEVLVHDPQRNGSPRFQIYGVVNRKPGAAKKTTRGTTGLSRSEVVRL